ncbi:DEAD/DEAH box helicase [Catenovulum sp. 2E275]|uniref:DEAD/DEAH box helicase n=1 Tax=Catenovulum sp. 2E275 TaxID=2980497 RepID=UPI0021CEF8E8|nr:DEAD/DEAH box helicase [Catenovulum sp. 2E275]MCU4675400.1 DEAD/DEAH box helicase [Catenovulum sp. 2E275]
MKFTELGLSEPILKAIEKQGYQTPSPIQAKAIPAILSGRDIMAAAQTGTGKTAGFTLPILEKLATQKRASSNQVKALVLTPTRELAAQVADNITKYSEFLTIRADVVYGGVKINPQMLRLTKGVEILVATPGRLLDLHQQNAVRFNELETFVLDEADRMLDMGFIRDIKKIINLLPQQRQNLMFSATFSEEIKALAQGLINNPIEISVTPANSTVETVEHWICPVDKNKKTDVLIRLIKDNNWQQALVFSRTKHGANRLVRMLCGADIKAAAIHGNKSQAARTKALADFKAGETQILVATDIAARGIDISQLPQVVNYDLPNIAEDYVHRIGRTGRAGQSGQAISLVCAAESKELFEIERLIQKVLPRQPLENFEPVNPLPESVLRAPKKKRPKKPKKDKIQPEQKHSGDIDSKATSVNQPSRNRQAPKNRAKSRPAKKQGLNENNHSNSQKSRENNNKPSAQKEKRAKNKTFTFKANL